jgi:pimeloyl-ACP methyl ester carboxylesterase
MWIAYAMASDFSNSVQKLAVTEASIPGVTEFPNIMMPKELIPFRAQFLFNQLPDLPEMLTKGREDIYLNYIFGKMAFKLDQVAIDEYTKAYKKKGAMKAGFEYYRAIPETKIQNEKRMENKLKMPVLALGGDHSGRLNNLKTMQSAAINVKGGELKDCGHYTPEECPDEFLKQLIPFLKE